MCAPNREGRPMNSYHLVKRIVESRAADWQMIVCGGIATGPLYGADATARTAHAEFDAIPPVEVTERVAADWKRQTDLRRCGDNTGGTTSERCQGNCP